jgi:hypothetical protein
MRQLIYQSKEACKKVNRVTTFPLVETNILPTPIKIGRYQIIATRSLLFGFAFDIMRDGELMASDVKARKFLSGKAIDKHDMKEITIKVEKKKPFGNGPTHELRSQIEVSICLV